MQKERFSYFQRLGLTGFLLVGLVFPVPVMAQVDFGVSTTVSQSDEWLLSELTNSKISVGQLRAGLYEPVKVVVILESFGKPAVDRKVKFRFEHQANVSEEVLGVTDQKGVWETTVASNIPGWVRVSGYDLTDGGEYKILDEEKFEILNSNSENTAEAAVFLGTQPIPRSGWFGFLFGWLESLF